MILNDNYSDYKWQSHHRKNNFSRETSVGIIIQTDAAIIWQLLTNAADLK